MRLQEEHRAVLMGRHHRLLAAQLLSWANHLRITLAGPPLAPLFPGAYPPTYSPETEKTIRVAVYKTAHAACFAEYLAAPNAWSPRGTRLFRMIFADCVTEPTVEFWAWFLDRAAHHVNGGSPGRVYMPPVRTR
jgi:hypothetical protein